MQGYFIAKVKVCFATSLIEIRGVPNKNVKCLCWLISASAYNDLHIFFGVFGTYRVGCPKTIWGCHLLKNLDIEQYSVWKTDTQFCFPYFGSPMLYKPGVELETCLWMSPLK